MEGQSQTIQAMCSNKQGLHNSCSTDQSCTNINEWKDLPVYLHALAAAVEWEAAGTEEGSAGHRLYFTTREQTTCSV